jgi:hypothetical protein
VGRRKAALSSQLVVRLVRDNAHAFRRVVLYLYYDHD